MRYGGVVAISLVLRSICPARVSAEEVSVRAAVPAQTFRGSRGRHSAPLRYGECFDSCASTAGYRRSTGYGARLDPGLAHSDHDVVEFLRRAGLEDSEGLLDDPLWVARRPDASMRGGLTWRFPGCPPSDVLPSVCAGQSGRARPTVNPLAPPVVKSARGAVLAFRSACFPWSRLRHPAHR
jgi:hypothetical protein